MTTFDYQGAMASAHDNNDDDDQTSAYGPGETSSHNDNEPTQAPPRRIAQHETRIVLQWKLLTLAVLVCSAVVGAILTHRYVRDAEQEQFEENFLSSAHKTLQAVGNSLEKTLKSLDSLTVSIVSNARVTNQTWPYVSRDHV